MLETYLVGLGDGIQGVHVVAVVTSMVEAEHAHRQTARHAAHGHALGRVVHALAFPLPPACTQQRSPLRHTHQPVVGQRPPRGVTRLPAGAAVEHQALVAEELGRQRGPAAPLVAELARLGHLEPLQVLVHHGRQHSEARQALRALVGGRGRVAPAPGALDAVSGRGAGRVRAQVSLRGPHQARGARAARHTRVSVTQNGDFVRLRSLLRGAPRRGAALTAVSGGLLKGYGTRQTQGMVTTQKYRHVIERAAVKTS